MRYVFWLPSTVTLNAAASFAPIRWGKIWEPSCRMLCEAVPTLRRLSGLDASKNSTVPLRCDTTAAYVLPDIVNSSMSRGMPRTFVPLLLIVWTAMGSSGSVKSTTWTAALPPEAISA